MSIMAVGINTKFANTARRPRRDSAIFLINWPPVICRPIVNMAAATKKFNSSKGNQQAALRLLSLVVAIRSHYVICL